MHAAKTREEGSSQTEVVGFRLRGVHARVAGAEPKNSLLRRVRAAKGLCVRGGAPSTSVCADGWAAGRGAAGAALPAARRERLVGGRSLVGPARVSGGTPRGPLTPRQPPAFGSGKWLQAGGAHAQGSCWWAAWRHVEAAAQARADAAPRKVEQARVCACQPARLRAQRSPGGSLAAILGLKHRCLPEGRVQSSQVAVQLAAGSASHGSQAGPGAAAVAATTAGLAGSAGSASLVHLKMAARGRAAGGIVRC